jgi:hypothetical protein
MALHTAFFAETSKKRTFNYKKFSESHIFIAQKLCF